MNTTRNDLNNLPVQAMELPRQVVNNNPYNNKKGSFDFWLCLLALV
jgi:hypothetical protein